MRSDRGTRREHLQRKQRRKPTPRWLQRGLKLGAAFGALLLVLGTPYWLISSGWVGQRINRMEQAWLGYTASAGLVSDNIFVSGRKETAPQDVTLALGVTKNQPLLAFDPATARTELEKLIWVKQASVQRRFPNTILVELTEREPVGFYQKNGQLSLVDETGSVLANNGLDRWAGLPVLVGEASPQHAPRLLAALREQPDIYRRVKALSFINQRRWNLRLNNNIDILLPEDNLGTALERLASAQIDGHLLDKDILSVDLRQGDRLIVAPTPAAAARQAAPKQGI